MTVRCLKSSFGKKALGANFLLVSQNGKNSNVTAPITSMAIMLGLVHWPLAFGASVSGSKMRDTAALNRRRPPMSMSIPRFLKTCPIERPWNALPRS